LFRTVHNFEEKAQNFKKYSTVFESCFFFLSKVFWSITILKFV